MADPVDGPQSATGPHPGGIEEDEVAAPGGAVVGDAGVSATEPGDADIGGDNALTDDATRSEIDAADEAD